MKESIILTESEYARLLEEIQKLQARITVLTALRDDLVYHVCPALQAEYDEKIVSLERELMAANMYLQQLQRTIEILQAQMNQQQEVSLEEAEAQAKKENKEYEDELNRKAKEAREFKKKWEESQWSEHDREERESKDKEPKGGKGGKDPGQESGDKDNDGSEQEEKDRKSGGSEQEEKDRKSGGSEQEEKDRKSGGSEQEEKDRINGSSDRKEKEGGSSGEDDADRDGEDDGDEGEGKEETIVQKIRRLYRKIVKRLHPDVHPNPTEREKDLLNRAMKAFREGNLEELERIWEELSGMDAPEDMFDDTPEGRAKLRAFLKQLKTRLQLLELEIEHIKSEFPYKVKSFLEDPVAVEEVRRGIQAKIDTVREMNRQLEAFINELKEKLRKGEKL